MTMNFTAAGLLLGVSLLAPSLRAQSAPAAPAASPDEIAAFPPFTRQTIDGRAFTSGDAGDRPLLLVFWAAWCAACTEEAPALRQLHLRHGSRLRMAGIAAKEGETADEVRRMAQTLRLNYPVIYDHDDSLRSGLNVKLIPQLVLLDGKGRFILRTMDLETLQRKLAEIIPSPSANPRSVHATIRAPTPRN